MDPVTELNTLPLSIAELDPAAYPESSSLSAPLPAAQAPPGLSSDQQKALAAVTVRAGEVEAAEWTLDQAKAACDAQIAAALAAGVPAETVAAAAGVCAAAVAKEIG